MTETCTATRVTKEVFTYHDAAYISSNPALMHCSFGDVLHQTGDSDTDTNMTEDSDDDLIVTLSCDVTIVMTRCQYMEQGKIRHTQHIYTAVRGRKRLPSALITIPGRALLLLDPPLHLDNQLLAPLGNLTRSHLAR